MGKIRPSVKKIIRRWHRLTLRRKLIVILVLLFLVGAGIFIARQIIRADILGTISNQGTLTYTNRGGQTETITSNINQITLTGDATAPTGSISINNGAVSTASPLVTLNLSATDTGGSGLGYMEFSNNNSLWTAWQSYATTYINWDLTNATYGGTTATGTKYVYVKYKDNAGNISSSYNDSITYSTSTPTPSPTPTPTPTPTSSPTPSPTPSDTTPPTVSITSPANGSTAKINTKVTITASASDNSGVTKVGFYINSVLIATDTSSPYSYSWNTRKYAAGTYIITAKAYDAAGNMGQFSISVTLVK